MGPLPRCHRAAPSGAPSGEPSGTPAVGAVEHKTGATDVILRYDEGGGFMIAGFSASQTPPFTLYGDGTVIFRNPLQGMPAAQGSVQTFNPMRTAKLSEEQIQELLLLALSDGGLAAARPNYENNMVADAGTTVFTIDAGGIKKTVSVYALGLDDPSGQDAVARAAFKKLADRLADFDQGGSIATDVFTPDAYRATLIESPGIAAPDIRDWPWKDLTVADFKARCRSQRPAVPAPDDDAGGDRPARRQGQPGRLQRPRPAWHRQQAVYGGAAPASSRRRAVRRSEPLVAAQVMPR